MNVIPGTNVSLKVYEPTGQRPPLRNNLEARQRRGLLAMVHIAKKERGLNEGEYEMILSGFQAGSAGELTIPQLERLVKYLKKLGWKPARRRRVFSPPGASPSLMGGGEGEGENARLAALRRRCVEIAKSLDNGEKRLTGLAAKICGVANLIWCHDAAKLERLLAVLGKIKLTESATENGGSHEKN